MSIMHCYRCDNPWDSDNHRYCPACVDRLDISTQPAVFGGWLAVDRNTYDGADDSPNRHQIGIGKTEEEAIENLLEILLDAS